MVAKAATEESARNASFQMFRNQGPDYYGDQDEMDADLAGEEDAAARKGELASCAWTRLSAVEGVLHAALSSSRNAIQNGGEC